MGILKGVMRPGFQALKVLEGNFMIGESRYLCTLSILRANTTELRPVLLTKWSCKPDQQIQTVRYLFKLPKLPKLNTVVKSSKRKEYSERRVLGYSMEQMYDVVADVGSYKDFIPWCTNSYVFDTRQNGFKSHMEIGFPPLSESYVSTIKLVRPHLVHSECTEGKLFTQLLTVWRFSPGIPGNPKSCTLDFSVLFEFRSQLHSQVASIFFDEVVKTMVSAFLKRAYQCYGPESIKSQKPKVLSYSS